MKTSAIGQQFIKSFEKLFLVAYPDPTSPIGQACIGNRLSLSDYRKIPNWQGLSGKPWTIGYGRTTDVQPGMACDEAQADAWFAEELEAFERSVANAVKVPITTRQNDALVSFSYNVGAAALRSSTLLRMLNAGDYSGASNRFEDWNKGTVNGVLVPLEGLTKRRKAEAKIFRVGIYDMHDGPSIDGNQMPDFSDVQGGVA